MVFVDNFVIIGLETVEKLLGNNIDISCKSMS